MVKGRLTLNNYGGTTTIMSTLPVGTSFYVCNGNWNGMIIEKNGVKHIKIEGDKEIPLTGKNKEHILDIEITESKYEVTYEQVSIRKMIIKAKSLEEVKQNYEVFDCVDDYEIQSIKRTYRNIKQVK